MTSTCPTSLRLPDLHRSVQSLDRLLQRKSRFLRDNLFSLSLLPISISSSSAAQFSALPEAFSYPPITLHAPVGDDSGHTLMRQDLFDLRIQLSHEGVTPGQRVHGLRVLNVSSCSFDGFQLASLMRALFSDFCPRCTSS